MLRDALDGFCYVPRAVLLLLRTPSLWGSLLVPVFLNVALFAFLSWLLLPPALAWIDGLAGGTSALATFTAAAMRVFLIIVFLVVLGILVLQFGSVLGAPWYESLSTRIETLVTGNPPPDLPGGPTAWIRDIGQALWFQARKVLLLGSFGLLLLVLGLVPVLGSAVALVGGAALGTLTVFLDILEPSLERAGRPGMRARIALYRRTLPSCFTLAATCLVLNGIPLLSLLSVPVCVAAGTLFYCERCRGHLIAPGNAAASAAGRGA